MSRALPLDHESNKVGILPLVTTFPSLGNAAGVETTLHAYTLPAQGLERDGDSIRFEYLLSVTQAAGNVVKLKFGSDVIVLATSGAGAPGGGQACKVTGRLTRIHPNQQILEASFSSDPVTTGISDFSNGLLIAQDVAVTAIDLTLLGNGTLQDAVILLSALIDFRGVIN